MSAHKTIISSYPRRRVSIISRDCWIPAFAGMTKQRSSYMIQLIMIIMVMVMMSACGIKKDVIRPSDIPEYEKQQEKKRGSLPI
ncbi:MAG: hypothetical protein EAZ74_03575 [Alphaproteobacteria bacterium]|nr:MAG: hypothetical protein EAY76_01680 [Alphaproteobacteria bacterium]TAF14625.1 MAG: hypothetical protein EAZ74_03575 [Alphaproteobacteria bacterium]TAF41712.1 MAG: hypothetical protein EAZ66_00850 [Alphaproteobacteria bacterium]TAF75653.1 MAG: hypothetical protein EAZ52_06235 [Alphaproteobacteria bacterium]